ncbi:MAG: tetratricopeptide repeat protein [Xenococcus sp. (in: cyanobacteria)]
MLPKLLIRSLILAIGLTFLPTVAQAGKNRIVELKGEAQIQLAGTTKFQPVHTGMTMVLGDILLPSEETVVIVNCSDGKLGKAQAGVRSGLKAICPSAKSTDPRDGDNIFLDLLREEFTYQTLLLSENPLLTWPSISGVDSYRVKVQAGEQVIWEEIVEGTSVEYKGEPLVHGFFYDLVVKAVIEDEPAVYQLKMRLVNPVTADFVSEQIAVIENESVSEEAQALMLVDYYLEKQESVTSGFLLAAARPLEKLVQTGNQTPVVHRLLGDIYLRLGWQQEAKETYQKAILLAEAENNLSETAAAQVGLAHLAVSEGNFLEAIGLLGKAQEVYKLMENSQQLNLIQDWLMELEQKSKKF